MSESRQADERSPDPGFSSTQWSIVLRAGGEADGAARPALESLCGRYWYPLYAYVRGRVGDAHAAQDLTQAFFARLLEKRLLARASPERGRFRAFLLASLKNFLANEHDRAAARKRGGGRAALPLDWDTGESRLSLEPRTDLTPDRIYDRQWAILLLDLVLDRLRAEYAAAGKGPLFDRLKDALAGTGRGVAYDELARDLGLSADAARQAASRLRKRYRELLRAEVAATVDDPADVDDEIRGLFAALQA
jgi:RNA polymerase sigma-70 factor (ECF subfamily)